MATKKTYGFLIHTKEDAGLYDDNPSLDITLTVVSVEGRTIRNLSSSFDDEPLADFAVKGYCSAKYGTGQTRAGFFDLYEVTRQGIKRMDTVYKKLDKGQNKLNEQFGYAKDFGAQVARIAHVLGIDFVVRTTAKHGSSYDEQEHQFFAIGDSVPVLNTLMHDFLSANVPQNT